jgi:hypothetical protein
MTMRPKSIPAVKVPAMTPLQQPRRFRMSFRGGHIVPGAAATDYPAAALPSFWQPASENSSRESFIRIPVGRLSLNISSFFTLPDSFIHSGRDVVHQHSSGPASRRRFNRFSLTAAVVFSLQRYQQKIYRVAFFGPCRIATPEDVPA